MKRIIFYSLDDQAVKVRRCKEQHREVGVPIRDYFDGVMPDKVGIYEFWDGPYYFMGHIMEYHKSNVAGRESYIKVQVFGEPKTKEG